MLFFFIADRTTPTPFLHWFVLRKKGREVSSFSKRFINRIATCYSSLDSSDIMKERSFGYLSSASCVSKMAGLFAVKSYDSFFICNLPK